MFQLIIFTNLADITEYATLTNITNDGYKTGM